MKKRTCIRLKWYYRAFVSHMSSSMNLTVSLRYHIFLFVHDFEKKLTDRKTKWKNKGLSASAEILSLCFWSLFIFIPALQVSSSQTVLIWVYPWSTATAISQLSLKSSLFFIFSCILLDASSFSPEGLQWPYIELASLVPWILPDLSEALQE